MTDSDELAQQCEEQRKVARAEPITPVFLEQAKRQPYLLAPFFRRYGKFRIEVVYETYVTPPRWVAMVSILQPIAEGPLGAPEEVLLLTDRWTTQDIKEATDILGQCLGSEIIGKDQDVTVSRNSYSLSWSTHDQRGTATVH